MEGCGVARSQTETETIVVVTSVFERNKGIVTPSSWHFVPFASPNAQRNWTTYLEFQIPISILNGSTREFSCSISWSWAERVSIICKHRYLGSLRKNSQMRYLYPDIQVSTNNMNSIIDIFEYPLHHRHIFEKDAIYRPKPLKNKSTLLDWSGNALTALNNK